MTQDVRAYAEAVAEAYGFVPELELDQVVDEPDCLGDVLEEDLGELGAPPGFDALLAGVPQAQAAWSKVAPKLSTDPGILYTAQQQFLDAYTQITQTGGIVQNNAKGIEQAASAAGALVANVNTIEGAVSNVTGLISAAKGGVPSQIVQSFTGALLTGAGLAVSAGLISTGVGAVIVAGISAAAAIASVLAAPPSGTKVCDVTAQKAPTFVIGCVASYSAIVPSGPGTPYWRKFPREDVGDDAWWFQLPSKSNVIWTDWTGGAPKTGTATDEWVVTKMADWRPVDQAWGVFRQLECDLLATEQVAALPTAGGAITWFGTTSHFTAEQVAFARFVRAYHAAWLANHEYELNGLKAQPDWMVLDRLVQFWNAAHAPGKGISIAPRSSTSSAGDVVSPGSSCQGNFTTEYYYVQMLVNDLAHQPNSSIVNGVIPINTGDVLTTHKATGVGGKSAPSSAAGTVVAVTGVAAVLAAGTWLALGRPELTIAALKAAFGHATRRRREDRA